MNSKTGKFLFILLAGTVWTGSLTACRHDADGSSAEEAANSNVETQEAATSGETVESSGGGLELGIPEEKEPQEYDENDTVIVDNGNGELEFIVPEDQDFAGE